jgi:hypothetical protein
VWVVVRDGKEFVDDPGYITDVNWQQVAALFSKALVVVGNDSAPIHLAGLMDIPGLALLGPTTANIFNHLPSVMCMSAKEESMPCGGCWFTGSKYRHYPCATGCAGLSCLRVRDVLNTLGAIISKRLRSIAGAER